MTFFLTNNCKSKENLKIKISINNLEIDENINVKNIIIENSVRPKISMFMNFLKKKNISGLALSSLPGITIER